MAISKRREYKNRITTLAAQEQVIRTNAIKAKIGKIRAKSKCRLCGKVDEALRHIVCE